jgi:hypothetical protein
MELFCTIKNSALKAVFVSARVRWMFKLFIEMPLPTGILPRGLMSRYFWLPVRSLYDHNIRLEVQ